jgi:putative membrane protein
MNEENRDTKLREHLANERTFPGMDSDFHCSNGAWFCDCKIWHLPERSSLMLEDLNITISEGFSAAVGTGMVAMGVILAFFAFFQYKKVETQINRQNYKSSSLISVLLTLVIVVGGIFLVIHLLTGIII